MGVKVPHAVLGLTHPNLFLLAHSDAICDQASGSIGQHGAGHCGCPVSVPRAMTALKQIPFFLNHTDPISDSCTHIVGRNQPRTLGLLKLSQGEGKKNQTPKNGKGINLVYFPKCFPVIRSSPFLKI